MVVQLALIDYSMGVFQVYESLTLPFSCGAHLMASFNNDNNFNRIS